MVEVPKDLAGLMVGAEAFDVDAGVWKETVLPRPEIDDIALARQRRLLVRLVDGVGDEPAARAEIEPRKYLGDAASNAEKSADKEDVLHALEQRHVVHGRSLRHLLALHRFARGVPIN